MFIATLTIRSRLTPPAVVVWVKLFVTVPAPVRSRTAELVLSTATTALPNVAAKTTNNPRTMGNTRASFQSIRRSQHSALPLRERTLSTRHAAEQTPAQPVQLRAHHPSPHPHLFGDRNAHNLFSADCRIILLAAIAARDEDILFRVSDYE